VPLASVAKLRLPLINSPHSLHMLVFTVPSSSASCVQLAVGASRAALRVVARDRLMPPLDPSPTPEGFGASDVDGHSWLIG
jgi:hypothetical protein